MFPPVLLMRLAFVPCLYHIQRANEILQEARTLAVKAGAASSQQTQRELEAIKGALDRIQSGLYRIQSQTDAWADEPLEPACGEW
jgi:hypothetical protein